MRLLIMIYCLFSSFFSKSQELQRTNIVGKYIKSDKVYPALTEFLSLKEDNTFEYFRRAAFTTFRIEGVWRIDNGYLILNNSDSLSNSAEIREKIQSNVKADKFQIKISYADNTIPHCTVIVNKGDKKNEITYKNVYGTITIPKKNVKSVTVYSVIKHMTYLIKDCKSNYLEMRLNPNRFFDDEKWLLVGEYIIPIGLDGEYASYPLSKQH